MISNTHFRFVGELLLNISKSSPFEGHTIIGNGLSLEDILPIPIEIAEYRLQTGFAGVYLIIKGDGHCFFRAQDKGKTKAFSINAQGLVKAFSNAVIQRGEYCGFTGSIDPMLLTPPTIESINAVAEESYGHKWISETGFEKRLRAANY